MNDIENLCYPRMLNGRMQGFCKANNVIQQVKCRYFDQHPSRANCSNLDYGRRCNSYHALAQAKLEKENEKEI